MCIIRKSELNLKGSTVGQEERSSIEKLTVDKEIWGEKQQQLQIDTTDKKVRTFPFHKVHPLLCNNKKSSQNLHQLCI